MSHRRRLLFTLPFHDPYAFVLRYGSDIPPIRAEGHLGELCVMEKHVILAEAFCLPDPCALAFGRRGDILPVRTQGHGCNPVFVAYADDLLSCLYIPHTGCGIITRRAQVSAVGTYV